MLEIPERFAEVDIICLRVLKSEELAPELIYLLITCCFDLVYIRLFVYQLALLKNRHEELDCSVIIYDLALPYSVRVEYLERLAVRDRLVSQHDEVRDCLSCVISVKSYDLLEARVGDLLYVLGDLHLRHQSAVFPYTGQLIDTAEYRFRSCRDKSLAYTKRIDFRTFKNNISDDVLIERVADDDLAVCQPLCIEHLAALPCQVCDVSGVDTHTHLLRLELLEHLDRVRES